MEGALLVALIGLFYWIAKVRGIGHYGPMGAIMCGFFHLGAILSFLFAIFSKDVPFLYGVLYGVGWFFLGLFLREIDFRNKW